MTLLLLHRLTSPRLRPQASGSPRPHQPSFSGCCCRFGNSQPDGCEATSHCGLGLYFLTIGDMGHLLMRFWAICLPLGAMSLQVLLVVDMAFVFALDLPRTQTHLQTLHGSIWPVRHPVGRSRTSQQIRVWGRMLEFEARLGVCPQANEVASTQDKRNHLEESLPPAVRKSLLVPSTFKIGIWLVGWES